MPSPSPPTDFRPESDPGRRAVFLDRDGVINADSRDYVKGWTEFRFLPGSLDAMVRLARAGLPVLVVTNQSALARGLLSPDGLADIHRRMAEAVRRAGGRIDGIYFCPHHPDDGCACRKPLPGLVERAAAEHGVDPARSWLVGDSERDIRCGEAAGVGTRILVRTGNGRRDEAAAAGRVRRVVEDLAEAVDWILSDSGGIRPISSDRKSSASGSGAPPPPGDRG
jgi:D-glycero-D-manno-heptose 1,7-bisphosphate phosphatase